MPFTARPCLGMGAIAGASMLVAVSCAESEDLNLSLGRSGGGGGAGAAAGGAAGESTSGGSGGQGTSGGSAGSGASGGSGGGSGVGGDAATIGDARTTSDATDSQTLFFDDFETGSASRWVPNVAGDWSVVTDGATRVYQQGTVSNSLHVATAGNTAWADQAVEAKVKILSFGGSSTSYVTAVYARFRDLDNHYYLAVESNTKLSIRSRSSGTDRRLTTAVESGMTTKAWHTVKLQAKGSILTAYVNGAEKATISDSSIATGGIGLGGVNCSAQFDDVKVTAP